MPSPTDVVAARVPGQDSNTRLLPPDPEPEPAPQRPRARDLNELIRYTMWSVFRVTGPGALEAAGAVTGVDRAGLADEVAELCPAGGRAKTC